MSTTVQVEALLPWGAPKEVNTKLGPRRLHKAPADEKFWETWRAYRDQLKTAGVSVTRNQSGEWEVCWWRLPDAATVAKQEAAIAASWANAGTMVVPTPEGLALRPFQIAGVQFALAREGTLIGDEMGLGKTVQLIGVINTDETIQKVIVVTKASLKENWRNELTRWLTRPLRVAVQYAGTDWVGTDADIVVINFEICHRYKTHIDATPWDLAGVDEVQQCKNRKARRTEVVLGAPMRQKKVDGKKVMLPVEPGIKARRRIALSGTPLEQRTEELFTVLRWLAPKDWPSYWRYAERYCGYKVGGDTKGATNIDELNRKLRSSIMIRRLKADVLKELPPKTHMVVELEPDDACRRAIADEQRELDEIRHRAASEVEAAAEASDDFEGKVEALRSPTAKWAFTEIARIRHNTAVAKCGVALEALLEDIEEAGKVLVFAHHKDVLQTLHDAIPGSVMITGDTPPEKRQAIVDHFQRTSAAECPVFFGSIRATGEGLTLTAATLVVFVEEDWVPGKMAQCEDRAHRIGQHDHVLVKHYVLPGSIDVKIAKSAVRKAKVSRAALDAKVVAPQTEQAPAVVVLADPGKPSGPVVVTTKNGKTSCVVTDALRELVHSGLRRLAGNDPDRAAERNDIGFSSADGVFGHSLAERTYLTDKMVPYALRMCRKYHRQLGEEFAKKLEELTR